MSKKQTINLVNNIVKTAEERGVAKLILDNKEYDGKNIIIDNKNLINFGSYSYLGLEVDKRLKQGAIEAVEKYGIQYPSSRIYTSLPIYCDLERQLGYIFQAPVIMTTSLSLGHIGVMPIIMGSEDLVILDQHVHSSVQDAAQRLRAQGTAITIIRHNNIEDLENKIQESLKKYKKVWYAIDGIYSMYGDCAPIKEIEELLNKYDHFYLYADDSHGVSSFGPNGGGWVLSKINFHSKMVLASGMAKAFGAMGGIFAMLDMEMYEKVRNCTGSLIFSGPHPIPVLGASVASAKIHLSDEIIIRQQFLLEKIKYCHRLLLEAGVPNISDPETPIFFVPVGLLKVGYNLVKKMLDDGTFVNLASFPAVSESCTGVRFTITLHHTLEDIEKLVNAFKKNYPLALKEENRTEQDIRRAFRHSPNLPNYINTQTIQVKHQGLQLIYEPSITKIDPALWNKSFEDASTFDWTYLKMLEEVFTNNVEFHNNWDFHYILIKDSNNAIILATFFTVAHVKEDMLASVKVSEEIEEKRKKSPYILSSRMLMMGSLITEGKHLYLNRSHTKWKEAMTMLIAKTEDIQEKNKINSILLRDFETEDEEFASFLKEQSFLKIELPDSHYIDSFSWNNVEEFLGQFKRHRRSYLKKIVLKQEDLFDVNICKKLSPKDIEACYELYKNVNAKSLEINTFDLPKKLFEETLQEKDWEVILLTLMGKKQLVAMMFCYKSTRFYYPALVGLDYDFIPYNIYPQILWQTVKRAKELNSQNLTFGYTAAQNKRKFGAKTSKKTGYIQSKDNYNLMLVNLLEG